MQGGQSKLSYFAKFHPEGVSDKTENCQFIEANKIHFIKFFWMKTNSLDKLIIIF